jgi:hypothetical protein
MKKTIFVVIGLVSTMLLAACSGTDESNVTNGAEVENIKELVNDYSVGKINDQTASITSHQLIVTNSDKSQLTYDLPTEEFFVSIAPYINETHP